MDCQAPGTAVGGKLFPTKDWDATGPKGCFQAVLVAHPWPSTIPCSSGQLREEDHLGKPHVIHSDYVSDPPELGLHNECFNPRHHGSAKYLTVGDSVLPGDAQDPSLASEVELMESSDLPLV